MSARAFTDEQRRAIDRRDGGLLVAAGAGSGKTSVLVERIAAAVIDDGCAIDEILAITFTEKAAAELKARVRERFAAAGRHADARAAEGAFISTIHGFCAQLLRAHALAAGIDPEFRVLDQLESDRLGGEAFDGALAEFLHDGAGADRLRLVAAYTPDRLAAMTRTAYGHLRSRGQEAPELPEIEPPAGGGEPERVVATARAALAELEGAGDGVRVSEGRERLERCLLLLADAGHGDAVGALDPAALAKLTLSRAAGALKTEACDAYREALEALHGHVTHLHELRDHALLRVLLRAYGDRYAALKRDRSGLDFDDLELVANRLLAGDEVVRGRWAGRFRHVLVDEFQDTNPLQNELLERIAGERMFRVGDEFQSIYRFRHADVSVFRDQAERARGAGRFEALTANFRSAPAVLGAIDLLFGAVWGARFPRLRAGGAATPLGDGPAVELLVADRPHNGSRWRERFDADAAAGAGPDPELAFGESLREVVPHRAAEARMLAKRIDQLIAAGECAAGDVVVLVRATTHLAAFERALEDRGIPTYVMGGRGYWSAQQVGDLRAYLGALANPLDDLALYTALASPLGGVSLDALVVVADEARRRGREPWTVVADLDASLADRLGARDAERIARFAALLAGERAGAPRRSLEALIDRAVTESGYDLHLLAQEQGRRRMANVRKLMRLAREYEAEEGRDLRGFIDYVAERDELGDRQGEAPLEPEDVQAVRLMTVHRAKGLEFPVVCVADLGKPGREDRSSLQISDDGAVGISLAQLGGGSVASSRLRDIRERQKLADEEEEKRVFYVAATRAERHLILSGGTDLDKLREEEPLEEPMRWVWRALAPELPEIETAATVVRDLDGRSVPIGVTVLRPDTVDAVLPAADRAPERAEPPPAGLEALDAPALAAVPPPPALPVSRTSYSGLARHAACGYRFYLERVLRLPRSPRRAVAAGLAEAAPDGGAPAGAAGGEATAAPAVGAQVPGMPVAPEPEAMAPTLRGSLVHQLLEEIDLSDPAVPAADAITALIERAGEPVRDHEVADVAALVQAFADSPLRARLAAADRVRTELPFVFQLPSERPGGRGTLINGVVDVHASEPGRVLIVDYKTDRLLDGQDPAELVDAHYATQRLVYALAALQSGAPAVEVAYLFLDRPAEPVSATYAATDQPALADRLRDRVRPLADGRFQPSDRPWHGLCADCPGQGGLCSWPPERTLAPEPPA
ncbi:MAG: UvrD-helicase domain-containing protein [Solirubrobacterales bacterium]|nr:UvrD-helicase domain-containing protein [Solirubrobacterales bacterium]